VAVINPEELFGGFRFRRLSDSSRLYWPYLFLASNGYGRLELNYHLIRGRVFADFDNPPSENKFWETIAEYKESRLIFLYEHLNSVWGQWLISQNSLPRFKTAKDHHSPEPPEQEYNVWKQAVLAETEALPKYSGNFFKELPKTLLKIGKKTPLPSPNTSSLLNGGEGKGVLGVKGLGVGEFNVKPESEKGFMGLPKTPAEETPSTPPPSRVGTNGFHRSERFPDWIKPWTRVPNPKRTQKTYELEVSSEMEPAAFACRDRYLQSQEVADGLIIDPTKFIDQQKPDWAGQWPAASKPIAKKSARAENFARRHKEKQHAISRS
jgi:hypothetical protein